MTQLWKHKTSGDVYAVLEHDGEIKEASNALHWKEVRDIQQGNEYWAYCPDTTAWIKAHIDDFDQIS